MPKLKQSNLKVRSKVRYQPAHYGEEHWENGVVKEIPEHTTKNVRVVYNCNDEWGRIEHYTSTLTRLTDLKEGWL